ncbi:hypothetical protein PF004_g1989 [Phytophthora fragariae]|uniref:Uncharacterized protein n=2 Tax=Phytophthora fragariae TaxID=53985 RepID=A0A6G0PQZ8_9STRA|nr:hypothetical protein PF004_g1989 [Phytophthora fragariae]
MPEVNSLLIKRCDLRERLDIVHARAGIAALVTTDVVADWEAILPAEEQRIHEAYGLDSYAASSQPDEATTDDGPRAPLRYAKAAIRDITITTYFRILRVDPDSPMDDVDVPLTTLVAQANNNAYMKWCPLYRKIFEIPATKRRSQITSALEEAGPMYLTGVGRAQSDHLTEPEWRILRIFPYTVGTWSQTPMGRAPHGARSAYFEGFPFLCGLVHGIVSHGDWSGATLAPSGRACGEETEDSE